MADNGEDKKGTSAIDKANYYREQGNYGRKKAIMLKCRDCSGDSHKEVSGCPVERCPLWPFRTGGNPFTKHKGRPDWQKSESEDSGEDSNGEDSIWG